VRDKSNPNTLVLVESPTQSYLHSRNSASSDSKSHKIVDNDRILFFKMLWLNLVSAAGATGSMTSVSNKPITRREDPLSLLIELK